MSKYKTTFILEENGSYPKHHAIVNIIGKRPDSEPYLSISIQNEGNEVFHSWMKDKDLERFAVNILRALESNRLK